MKKPAIVELQYIAAIANVPSILDRGILCHAQAQRFKTVDIASPKIQERRKGKRVPNGAPLHEYVNLYFCARNPMLYSLKERHGDLCILCISANILYLPGAVITDGNAASDYTRFWPSPEGLDHLHFERIFASDWRDSNQIQEWENKRVKCAEVLVPRRVDPKFILAARVSGEGSRNRLLALAPTLEVMIDPYLFFCEADL